MTRRDFELIARVLREHYTEAPTETTQYGLAAHFASELAAENPRFDRERFLQAAGVEDPS